MRKIPKRRGKRVILLSFLAPGSLGPSKDFSLKKPARLGEPVTLGVSLGSPGRAAMVLNALFSINRRERQLRKRVQHSVVKEIERIRKEEEETKPRRYQTVIVINLYIVSHSVFFVLPTVSFVFQD